MSYTARAVGCVALAALIWSLDSAFRFSSVESLNPLAVVFLEHLFGLVVLLPFFWRAPSRGKGMIPLKHLGPVLALGLGGSALGILCYSESLRYLGPSTVNMFQLLKPFVVLGLAFLLLKEKGGGSFFQLASWILLSAVILCLPDVTFGFRNQNEDKFWIGVLWGLGATLAWGSATIAGKFLLARYPLPTVMFFRWLVGVVGLGVLLLWKGGVGDLSSALAPRALLSLLAFGTVLGVLPVWIYYHGLKVLPAGVATLIELLYPLFGIFFPVVRFHHRLPELQWIGAMMMLAGVFFLIYLELGFGSSRAQDKQKTNPR